MAPDEKTLGTGARSRLRRPHRPKHFGHGHVHAVQGIPIPGNPDLVSPIPSSASSSSVRSSPMLENWMGKFSTWKLIDVPVIPGTHHSGVNNPRKRTSQPVWGWAKCQDIGIEEQLHYGVRFLDLRVRVIPKTGEVLISHGLTSDTSLSDAFEVVANFLQQHQTETVIVYIRADKWHGVDKECSDLLAKTIKTSSLGFHRIEEGKSFSDILVSELSGKALLISTNETLDSSSGIQYIQNNVLGYCDIWQESSIEDAKSKIDKYMRTIPPAISPAPVAFGGVALDGTFPIRQQSQTSRELNAWFIQSLSSDDEWKARIEGNRFGIILIDFADFDILSFLIGINNKLINIRNSA
jgi:hypothetical protein